MPSNPQSPPADSSGEPDALDYLSIGLGWLIPGAGHIAIGETARGILFAIVIHGLFAMGLFVGGVRSINPPDQAIWSYTQFMAGWPMILSSYVEKQYAPEIQNVEREARGIPVQDVARRREFLKEHSLLAYSPELKDVGAVYCGIAGMLNLLVMFDVLVRISGGRGGATEETPEAASAGGGGA